MTEKNQTTMKAAVLTAPGSFTLQDVPVPSIAYDEVLIKVAFCGICSTDKMIFDGLVSVEHIPFIPGHEFVGTVAAVGSRVTRISIGSAVAVDINISCGVCRNCRNGEPLKCTEIQQIGIHRDGGFAEYAAVSEKNVFPIGTGVISGKDLIKYALVEPISNVVRAQKRTGSLLAKRTAVIGDDAMALFHLQVARVQGAVPIVLIATNTVIGKFGKQMGADTVVVIDEWTAGSEKLHQYLGYFDVVVQTSSRVSTFDMGVMLTGPGGMLLAAGFPEAGSEIRFDPVELVLNEKKIVSAVAGVGSDVSDAITLIQSNRLNLDPFISEVVSLSDVEVELKMGRPGSETLKVLVDLNQ
ncbi:MAG: alcohol dehydrogenase catalytic domain-containing protein [Spirochaetia bacterium]|nr:alcohol dehydrogenase catalytic domain-containing protein [Spirochaetia bacterium]